MRENFLPASADQPANHQPDLTTSPDADFLRHKQALASQVTMTRADILKPATATLSHW